VRKILPPQKKIVIHISPKTRRQRHGNLAEMEFPHANLNLGPFQSGGLIAIEYQGARSHK